jgi:hypothetical protein
MSPAENEVTRFLDAVRIALPSRKMLHIDELYSLARTKYSRSFAYRIVADNPDNRGAIEALRRAVFSSQDAPKTLIMVCKDNQGEFDA